jgi:hypothetical protein
MVTVKRVQTGMRVEESMLKVLKGLAEYLDVSLGELIEGIVLHAFGERLPFAESTITVIQQLSSVYGLDLGPEDSHHLVE